MSKVSLDFLVTVVIEPDENGFHAYCPALRGLHVSGSTKREAVSNANKAVCAYIESLIKHKDPIPVGVIFTGQTMGKRISLKNKRYSNARNVKIACAI